MYIEKNSLFFQFFVPIYRIFIYVPSYSKLHEEILDFPVVYNFPNQTVYQTTSLESVSEIAVRIRRQMTNYLCLCR